MELGALIIGLASVVAAAALVYFRPFDRQKIPESPIAPEPDPFELFEQAYRDHVRRGLRYVDLKGLQTLGHSSLELDQVYVDVGLVHRAPHQVDTDVLAGMSTDGGNRFRLDDFLGGPVPRVVAVLGGPGSGKTTLLRKTARDTRDDGTPILLFLRDHLPEILAESGLVEVLTAKLAKQNLVDEHGWVARKLRTGRCVVMLDGLDEVARVEDRRSVSKWVELQITAFPNNDFVLTSRPRGFLDAPVEGATALQVRPFTSTQVRDFIRGWYRATTGSATPEEAEDLLVRLDDAPALSELTVNPLLLTMIATVHQFRGALPGSRADLYKEICEVMLWHRQEAKKLDIPGNSRHKMVLLRPLAYLMMTKGVRQLGHDVLVAEFERVLRRLSTPVDAEEHLRQIVSDGLLVEWEREQFAFAHLTFQEFLAAAHIREKKTLVDELCYRVDEDWWRETTLLYVAGSDADLVITACLASGTATALGLALDCVSEGTELDEELRTQLDDILRSAVVDEGLREKVLRAMLVRHDRSAVRVASGAQVWRAPVPASLYRLFDDSSGIAGWGDDPARGMSRTAAARFARWLTETGLSHRFRLAERRELEDPGVLPSVRPLVVWAGVPEPGAPRIWTTGEHPHVVSRPELIRATRDDFTPQRLVALLSRFDFAASVLSEHLARLSEEAGGETSTGNWFVVLEGWFHRWTDGWSARLGSAFGDTLEESIYHPPQQFTKWLRQAFTAQVPLAEWQPEPIGDLADLRSRLNAVETMYGTWASVAHDDLSTTVAKWIATDVLAGNDLTRVRLTALALVREVPPADRQVLFQLAAAATLSDLWREGRRERTETIILAADAPESLSARPPR
ncbi:hypothetical protein JOD54_000181 [Actinokineospora baliensis]|uniref:NACHT domain-containing protein n=1 Tax=Actinokineospora baliensis TaxID=547056 RepID=UPI00195784C7|nr:NACHT domain-containing protein [Actinokineospora baliensis]MBM7769977.1 hypothetical protein [Actinokineospora baliensis]